MTRRTWIPTALTFTLALALAAAAAAQDEGITITEVQVGTAVTGGTIASPTTTIARDAGRIFAVIRLNNPSREAGELNVTLESAEGRRRGGLDLSIPAQPRYRTVARFGSNHPPGEYRIVIRHGERVLETVTITITG